MLGYLAAACWEVLTRRIDGFAVRDHAGDRRRRPDHAVLGDRPEPARIDTQLASLALRHGAHVGRREHPAADIHAAAVPLYVLGVVLLVGVALFGTVVNGSRRWLSLGITRIQPSELMKIAVPLMLAWYFQIRGPDRLEGLRAGRGADRRCRSTSSPGSRTSARRC